MACGARWAPLVRKLLRKERAISRHAVCTAHWRHRIALRNKMGDFVSRAVHLLSNRQPNTPMAIGDPSAQRRGGALAAGLLRRLLCRYRRMRNYAAAAAVMNLRSLFLDYKQGRDTEMAYSMLRMEPASSNLQLSPPGRQIGRAHV